MPIFFLLLLVVSPDVSTMCHDNRSILNDVVWVHTPRLDVPNVTIPLVKLDQSPNSNNPVKSAAAILWSQPLQVPFQLGFPFRPPAMSVFELTALALGNEEWDSLGSVTAMAAPMDSGEVRVALAVVVLRAVGVARAKIMIEDDAPQPAD